MSVHVLISAEFSPSPDLETAWLACLPAERRAALARSEPAARHRSLLATRLLAAALVQAGLPSMALATLQQPPRGRPTLALPVHFSLAHCEGRIVCALSTGGPVGVDVEALSGVRAEGFARYLSEAERAWAGRSSRRFYSIWTRKEAVVKAAGSRGLAAVPEVKTTPSGRLATFDSRTWRTEPLPVGRAHVAHLARLDAGEAVRVRRLSRQALEAL